MLIKGLFIIVGLLSMSACATDTTQNKNYDHHSYCGLLEHKVHISQNSGEDLNTQTRQTAINQAQAVQAYEEAGCQPPIAAINS